MLWAALLPELDPSTDSPRSDVLAGIATWALQFSPRVAVVESSAVVVEVSASTRLFGGRRKLAQRIREEGAELGLRSPSWAPTSLAALGLARAGLIDGIRRPLHDVVDALPITVLSAVVKHQAMLARLGCRTIGDVRALPRGGISRRFGAEVLAEMDQAYGLRPESHAWMVLPDTFSARIELMHRVDQAPAMLLGARRLLLQLCGWLAARRSGVTAFTLRYAHDVMRARDAGEGGELTVRTAQATRNVEHLTRLLTEHLARVQLAAPVGDLQLLTPEVHSLEEKSAGLLPDPAEDSEGLSLVLERVAARLGSDNVQRPVLSADHRMEWMVAWQPAPESQPRKMPAPVDLPQPAFCFPQPLKLAVKNQKPLYQGPLLLLSGPHRLEGGWWHRLPGEDGTAQAQTAVRDYYVALSATAGVLWVYQTRLEADASGWWLQGVFA